MKTNQVTFCKGMWTGRILACLMAVMMGLAFTACSDSNDDIQTTPIGAELYKMWYAETTVNYTFDDGSQEQLKQVTALKFDGDGTGREYSFYINGNNELVENAPMLLGADFTYTNVQGTISITRKDYLNDATKDLVRQLRHTDGTLLFGTTSLKPVTAEQQALLDAILPDGGNFSINNVNDRNVPGVKFDYKNWHEKSTIYLFDGQSHEYDWDIADRRFYKVYLPWSADNTHGVQSHIPSDLMDAMTPENGWEMVLNYCGRSDMPNANMIFFYNKYTGTMRVLYYIPQTFSGSGASDHYWEIQVTDNMAYRSPWRYGLPMDHTINADRKSAINQNDQGQMHDRIVPWCSETQTNGSIPPNPGWWAFDFDMSSYNERHVINDDDEIKLTMLTQDKSDVTLNSLMQGQISGTFDISKAGGFSGGDWANGILLGIGAIGKGAAGGVAFAAKDFKEGFSAVADALGMGAGIAGVFNDDGSKSYQGTISLGLTGTIDTKGKIQEQSSYSGFASGFTIKMAEFDRVNSHLGQGVWNITNAPFIYMTNQMHETYRPQWKDENDAQFQDGDSKRYAYKGCVWYFDPNSVQVELNPDIFPEGKIKWMQVDILPGARYANKATGTDRYRTFVGINSRNMGLNTGSQYMTDVVGDNGSVLFSSYGHYSNAEILTDYFYGLDKPTNVNYGYYAPIEQVDGYPQVVWGCGNNAGKYIIDPQMVVGGVSICYAPPVEVNVQVAVKMDDGNVYVFNRIFLPYAKLLTSSQNNLVDLWNNHINKDNNIKGYQRTRLETYDYLRKRAYDKIKFIYPKADITYETWDQANND